MPPKKPVTSTTRRQSCSLGRANPTHQQRSEGEREASIKTWPQTCIIVMARPADFSPALADLLALQRRRFSNNFSLSVK